MSFVYLHREEITLIIVCALLAILHPIFNKDWTRERVLGYKDGMWTVVVIVSITLAINFSMGK